MKQILPLSLHSMPQPILTSAGRHQDKATGVVCTQPLTMAYQSAAYPDCVKIKVCKIQTFHGRKEFSFKKQSLQVGTFRLFVLRTGCPFVCKLYIHISQLLSAVSWMFLNLPMNHCQWFPYAGYLVSLFISVLSSSIWGSLEESLTDNTETSFLKIYFYTSFGS